MYNLVSQQGPRAALYLVKPPTKGLITLLKPKKPLTTAHHLKIPPQSLVCRIHTSDAAEKPECWCLAAVLVQHALLCCSWYGDRDCDRCVEATSPRLHGHQGTDGYTITQHLWHELRGHGLGLKDRLQQKHISLWGKLDCIPMKCTSNEYRYSRKALKKSVPLLSIDEGVISWAWKTDNTKNISVHGGDWVVSLWNVLPSSDSPVLKKQGYKNTQREEKNVQD